MMTWLAVLARPRQVNLLQREVEWLFQPGPATFRLATRRRSQPLSPGRLAPNQFGFGDHPPTDVVFRNTPPPPGKRFDPRPASQQPARDRKPRSIHTDSREHEDQNAIRSPAQPQPLTRDTEAAGAGAPAGSAERPRPTTRMRNLPSFHRHVVSPGACRQWPGDNEAAPPARNRSRLGDEWRDRLHYK